MTIREITITKLEGLSESLLYEVSQFIDRLQAEQLTDAAQNALDDYKNDPELTAFTALDGEDFHDEDA
jgi:hypothetical protein